MIKHLHALFLLVGSLCATSVFADLGNDYSASQKYIHEHHMHQDIGSSVDHANSVLPSHSDNPDQVKYYDHPDAMTSDAQKIESKDDTYSHVESSILNRPRITIDQNSDMIKDSETVEKNAVEIASGTYKDCGKKVFHHHTYETQVCTKPNAINFKCYKRLSADVFKPKIPNPCMHVVRVDDSGSVPSGAKLLHRFTYKVPFIWFFYINKTSSFYQVPTPNDSGQCLIPGSFSYKVDSGSASKSVALGAHVPVTAYIEQVDSNNKNLVSLKIKDASQKDVASLATSSAVKTADFKNGLSEDQTYDLTIINSGHANGSSQSVTVAYLQEPKNPDGIVSTHWVDECKNNQSLIDNQACQLQGTKCLDPNSTRNIAGKDITEACWTEEHQYQCGGSGEDTCSAMEENKCTQENSTCDQTENGMCVRFKETWSCPKDVEIGGGLSCGKKFYCMDGSCQDVTDEKNKDFGNSITELSATASAASDVQGQGGDINVNPSNIKIFQGTPAHCKDVVLGALNCCRDTGWGKIIAHCSDEEKNLGLAKEKGGLVVYVGRYCSTRVLGVCLMHKKGYCIFPSKIAKDVQVDGRLKQLHHSFGSAERPNCLGISPDDIEKIDFDKVDFSNAVAQESGKTVLPSDQQSQSDIEKKIHEMIDQDRPHA